MPCSAALRCCGTAYTSRTSARHAAWAAASPTKPQSNHTNSAAGWGQGRTATLRPSPGWPRAGAIGQTGSGPVCQIALGAIKKKAHNQRQRPTFGGSACPAWRLARLADDGVRMDDGAAQLVCECRRRLRPVGGYDIGDAAQRGGVNLQPARASLLLHLLLPLPACLQHGRGSHSGHQSSPGKKSTAAGHNCQI